MKKNNIKKRKKVTNRWKNYIYKREADNLKLKLSETVKLKETEIATQKYENDSLRKTISQLEEKCNELKEKNQRNLKYCQKFMKYVDKVNDQSEKYLKETKAIRDLVKTRLGMDIFYSKDGKLKIRQKEPAQPQLASLSDFFSSP